MRAGARDHLTEAQVLAWARGHHDRTGRWPTIRGGPVAGALADKIRRLMGGPAASPPSQPSPLWGREKERLTPRRSREA